MNNIPFIAKFGYIKRIIPFPSTSIWWNLITNSKDFLLILGLTIYSLLKTVWKDVTKSKRLCPKKNSQLCCIYTILTVQSKSLFFVYRLILSLILCTNCFICNNIRKCFFLVFCVFWLIFFYVH